MEESSEGTEALKFIYGVIVSQQRFVNCVADIDELQGAFCYISAGQSVVQNIGKKKKKKKKRNLNPFSFPV
jgi:hypothetical protein